MRVITVQYEKVVVGVVVGEDGRCCWERYGEDLRSSCEGSKRWCGDSFRNVR